MLYPNPASAYVSVFMNDAPAQAMIYVYNVNGQCVMSQEANGAYTTLPIHHLSTGVYIVEVDHRVSKFVKE